MRRNTSLALSGFLSVVASVSRSASTAAPPSRKSPGKGPSKAAALTSITRLKKQQAEGKSASFVQNVKKVKAVGLARPTKKTVPSKRSAEKNTSPASGRIRSAPPVVFAKPARREKIVVAAQHQAEEAIHLQGKRLVFVGVLQLNRLVAATLATKAGAVVTPSAVFSPNPGTDVLVCGANSANRAAHAQLMGIPTMSELEFIRTCRTQR